jgi:hypothetical protein
MNFQLKLFPHIQSKIVYLFSYHFCWTAVKSGRELATSTLATYLYLTYLASLQISLKHQALDRTTSTNLVTHTPGEGVHAAAQDGPAAWTLPSRAPRHNRFPPLL